jgi:hypothetical protein
MACIQIEQFTETNKQKENKADCCANINRILESCVSSLQRDPFHPSRPYIQNILELWKGTICHGAIQAAVGSNRSKVASHPTDNPLGRAPQHKLPSKLAAHINTTRMSQGHIGSDPQAKNLCECF